MELTKAESGADICRIGDLAGQVMRMVEALVKQSDHQITDSASVLQKILAAAADERGEWQVPLSDASLEAMRKVPLSALFGDRWGILGGGSKSSFAITSKGIRPHRKQGLCCVGKGAAEEL